MTITEEVKASWKKRLEQGIYTQAEYDARVNMPGPEHNATLAVYLATDEAQNINGQIFHTDRGKVSIFPEPREIRAIFTDEKIWTVEQLVDAVPKMLLVGYTNPAPVEPPK
jgi:hypothetical protein